MPRILISQTNKLIGQTVSLKGWINSLRRHGQLTFADLRDRSGIIQVVGGKDMSSLKVEDVVLINGKVKSRDPKYINPKLATGEIEIEVVSFSLISHAAELPFDIHQPDLNLNLPALLDNRALSLRHAKTADIFRLQAGIIKAFRDYLDSLEFTEIIVPTIVSGSTEGGSEVFSVDYFGHRAFLAQSPQLYKQIMVTAFERVYTIAHAYRAEPSVTTRHLTEYTGLDVEFGFIDNWNDIIKLADDTVKAIFHYLSKNYPHVLNEYGASIPKTIDHTPVIKLKDALKLVSQRSGRNVSQELDLDPEAEREICRWAEEEYGSELVFITHFYTKKRAWYSQADPDTPEETLTFDLIGKGVEWISGGQRINDYDTLVEKLKSIGQNPKNFEFPYGQAFKYGMPPEGGFCIGLERITQNILGLDNLRQASLFPRDMERIDTRLAKIEKVKKKK